MFRFYKIQTKLSTKIQNIYLEIIRKKQMRRERFRVPRKTRVIATEGESKENGLKS